MHKDVAVRVKKHSYLKMLTWQDRCSL